MLLERQAEHGHVHASGAVQEEATTFDSADDMMDRVVESAIVRGVFGHSDASRRDFIRLVGGGTLATVLGTMIPLDKVKAAVKDAQAEFVRTAEKLQTWAAR